MFRTNFEGQTVVCFRQKGQVREVKFSGSVFVNTEAEKLDHVGRSELGERIDLTRVPVITIGGKKKHQVSRMRDFLAQNPGFQGAFLMFPGTGQYDLDDGDIIVTNRAILRGERVSGGRPEVQLVEHRWLRDGRYVATRSKMLHGKVLETLDKEVEVEPGTELVVRALLDWSGPFDHPLRTQCKAVAAELARLETLRVVLEDNPPHRNMTDAVLAVVLARATARGVRKVADLPTSPEGFVPTAEEIDSDIVARAETLGKIEVPGLGSRSVTNRTGWGGAGRYVELTLDDVRQVTAWPKGNVFPWVTAISDRPERWQFEDRDGLGKPMALSDEERWPAMVKFFAEKWVSVQRQRNWPKDESIKNPLEADPPATPASVTWGTELLTGEAHMAYAHLEHDVHGRKGSIVDGGWRICWIDDAAKAAELDREARREAAGLVYGRDLERRIAAQTPETALPAVVPAPYKKYEPTGADVMVLLGFTPEQYRVEGEGPEAYWIKLPESYFSEVRQREVQLDSGRTGYRWYKKDGDVIVVFANATGENVLAQASGFASESQVAQATETLKKRDDAEKERASRETAAFLRAVKGNSTFAFLPTATQEEIARIPEQYSWENSWDNPPNLTGLGEKLRAVWNTTTELERLQKRGEILVNWGGHFRTMGRSGNQNYWVVGADGSARGSDSTDYRKRYMSEGCKTWRLVGPEELALRWEKSCTAAPHHFNVVKLPVAGCTPEQVATARRLATEVAGSYEGTGATGMASGAPCPGIGRGWDLTRTGSIADEQSADEQEETIVVSSGPSEDDDRWAALRNFGKK